MKTTDKYIIVDLLASEYSWTVEYILALPSDVLFSLHSALVDRKMKDKQTMAKIIGLAVGCANSGKLKKLDNLFNKEIMEEVEPDTLKESMRQMWVESGKNPKEFDEQYEKGEVKF